MVAFLSGEFKAWHKVTLDFEGPFSTESADTFRNYRLDVTFSNQQTGEKFTVPGFFAADGDAANTGATSGSVWRVNFNPPSDGEWTYAASFRTGVDIAASTDPNAGTPVATIDGDSGAFSIAPSDKTGEDFRAKGMILQGEGSHYLQHQGDGDYFVRGGPGVPENFLATTDFDNTPTGRHDFSTHAQDFTTGDPTWSSGNGQNIIGAVNYIAEQGMNSVYVMTNTAGGDGKDVWPWAATDLNEVRQNDSGITSSERDTFSTYDVSKLAQWEIVFDHMDKKGIYKNVLFQETENDQLLNDGTDVAGSSLSVERLIYMREMIARFGHSNGVQWNLGEENTNTPQERVDMAAFVKAVDPYDHLVVLHTFPGQATGVYDALLGVEAFDGPSTQTTAGNIRSFTRKYVDASEKAGDPWVVSWDEDSSSTSVIAAGSNDPDSANEQALREGLWGMMTAGGSGVNWYIRGASGHSFDQNYDDFRGHESMWTWTSAALDFYNTYIPFWEMTETGDFEFSKAGEYYVAYGRYGDAAELQIDLSGFAGETFQLYWFNPRDGGPLMSDGQLAGGAVLNLGAPPTDSNKDWVALIKNTSLPELPSIELPKKDPSVTTTPISPDQAAAETIYVAKDGVFVLDSELAPLDGNWVAETKIDGFQGENYYRWDGGNRYGGISDDADGVLSFNLLVEDAGQYSLALRLGRTKEGTPDARDDENNDVFVRMDGGKWIKVFAGGMKWEAINGWGTTFDQNHNKSPARFNLDEGVHTFEVAGRSTNALLDKITLSNSGAVKNATLPNSTTITGPVPDPAIDEPTPSPGDPGGGTGGGSGGEPGVNPGGPTHDTGDISVSVFVVDSSTDQPIAEALDPSSSIDWSSYAGKPISLVVDVDGPGAANVDRVTLNLNNGAVVQTEGVAPYALFGDNGGDFNGQSIAPGDHTLNVRAVGTDGSLIADTYFDLKLFTNDGLAASDDVDTTSDVNGDGVDDLIWRNVDSGQVAMWEMEGGRAASYKQAGRVNDDWSSRGVDDFTGDGTEDLLWQNASSGQVVVWEMENGRATSYQAAGRANNDWSMVGTGDFDGDGTDDIAWRNVDTGSVAIWSMKDGIAASYGRAGKAAANWSVVGAGDFDGDGTDDIAWRNVNNGDVFVWDMADGVAVGYPRAGNVAANWSVVGIGDFDGDRTDDIAWRNGNDGEVFVWDMAEGQAASYPRAGNASSDWSAVGVGDYNGDSVDDIAWRNANQDAVVVWNMQGGHRDGHQRAGGVKDDWESVDWGSDDPSI